LNDKKPQNIPNHVGIILDGNRRWAKQQGLPVVQGHNRGSDVYEVISEYAIESGVKYLSVYVFSAENWKRTEEEVSFLMGLVVKLVNNTLKKIAEKDVKIVILGRRDKLSDEVLESIERAEELTKNNKKGVLAFCFNYGGKEEIVDAVKGIVEFGKRADEITAEDVASHLYHPEVPDIDLLIRTSGEQRLSGYMLWRSSYAELYFVQKHWPDFTKSDFDEALKEYSNRKRRFGK
jgi:undecaprenyl diphosphate synthase